MKTYTALVVLALLVVVGLQLWLGMPHWVALVIALLVIAIARLPPNPEVKLFFYAIVLYVVSAVPLLKYTLDLSTLAAIAIAVVVVPVVAFNCIPRMSYSVLADVALKRLAQDLRMELVAQGLGILEVEGIWGYGWPKMAILFESPEALEQAGKNGLLDRLAGRIAEAVRGDPAYGRSRKSFDAKKAVWGLSEQASWDALVAKGSFP
ncbi:MAG: hypothetical protein J0M13_19040 [Candidatus Accumulibacter sp.]|jgi:hypothetical protein|nr:hypothetical protein [Candidatus Accumulibacter necessarius]